MAFRGVALGNNGGAANTLSFGLTIPANVKARDILYVTSSTNFDGTNTASLSNTGGPIAWTQLSLDHDAANNNQCYLWEGVALADSAGQTVTVTWTPSSGRHVGILIAMSGGTTRGRSFAHNVFSTASVPFSAVTAVAGADIVTLADMRGAFTTAPTIATPPTGFTKDGESKLAFATSAEFTHSAFHESGLSAGSVTPSTVTANEVVNGHTYTIMVPPAKLAVGVNEVNLAVGANPVTGAFLGTAQVWP